MADFITFTILGLSLGSIYAIAASGLVMTYSTSAIFNFSHGAIAMFCAYLYWQLRVGWHLPAPISLAIVLGVICPLIGIVLNKVIFRRLRNTLLSTKIVIPIALMLLLIGAANWTWSNDRPRILTPFWGATSKVRINLGDSSINITYHQIAVLGISLVLAFVLYILLSRTRLGITMRAVVDDNELIKLNGGSPDKISSRSWIIGVMLAGLAGILIASLQNRSLDTSAITLLVVNAFAAGIFGKLKSVPATFIGALVVGLGVSYWNWTISTIGRDWDWLAGFRVSIPIIILFIILVTFPHERIRGAIVSRTKEQFSTPSVLKAAVWIGIAIIVGALIIPIAEPTVINLLSRGVALGIIALSIVALTGYTGEINLAPLAFAGIAAIVVFQVDVGPTGSPIRESLSFWGIVLAVVVCAIVGALIALPALRLKGVYLGLVTFSFSVIVSNMIFNQRNPLQLNIPWFGDGEDIEINLFSAGALFIPRPNWFGIDFKNNKNYFMLLIIAFALLAFGLILLKRSSIGRKLSALKDSPAASATLGMNLLRFKIFIFALSSGIAGLGGVLYASQQRGVNSDTFSIFQSLALVLVIVVAGVGYTSGALAGGIMAGVFFVMLTNIFTKLAEDYSSFEWLFQDVFANFFTFLGISFAAIGIAQRPGGFLNKTFMGYRTLISKPGLPFLGVWLGSFAIWYILRILDVINNWTFILILIFSVLALPMIAERVLLKRGTLEEAEGELQNA